MEFVEWLIVIVWFVLAAFTALVVVGSVVFLWILGGTFVFDELRGPNPVKLAWWKKLLYITPSILLGAVLAYVGLAGGSH